MNFVFLSQASVNQVTNQTHQVKVLEFCHVFYICLLLGVMVVWLFIKTLLISRTLHNPHRLEQLVLAKKQFYDVKTKIGTKLQTEDREFF